MWVLSQNLWTRSKKFVEGRSRDRRSLRGKNLGLLRSQERGSYSLYGSIYHVESVRQMSLKLTAIITEYHVVWRTYSSAESHCTGVVVKYWSWLWFVVVYMSTHVCLLYILHNVPSVLLVNPGNNEIVGGDWCAAVPHAAQKVRRTNRFKSVALTSKRQYTPVARRKDMLLFPDCVFAVVVNSSLTRSF